MEDHPDFFDMRLIKILSVLLLFTGLIGCNSDAKKEFSEREPIISTYYLIRHAEKDRTDSTDLDPELNQKGLGRAIRWAEVFDDVDLDAIFSTNYERTTMTAAPTSVKKNINIQFYDPANLVIEDFKAANEGQKVLIVGHSNTTPVLANQLLGTEEYQQMEDDDNSSLFVVQFVDSLATSYRLNMD